MESHNCTVAGCIAGGESCVTLHELRQCLVLRCGSIIQGVEVTFEILDQKLRYPYLFFIFLFEYAIRPKLVLPALGGIFHLLRHICLAVDGFSLVPVPVSTDQVLPVLIRTGEAIGTQNGVVCKEENIRVRDKFAHPVGLFLGILEFVDILRDTLHVLMVPLHLILEIENVCGMDTNAQGL